MKLAILHDYLNQYGGQERVLETIYDLYPGTPLFTLLYDSSLSSHFSRYNLRLLPFNLLLTHLDHRFLFPFFPLLLKLMPLKEYDTLLSWSHAWVKNIRRRKNQLHICYCCTPMRFAWDLHDFYISRYPFFLRPLLRVFLAFLRRWDKRKSQNVDYFIALSHHVADRINRFYNRKAHVIYPPVDTSFFRPLKIKQQRLETFYLIVSRLVEHKRVDIAVQAFNLLQKPLVIIGSGREYERLKRMSHQNITFLGSLSDKETRSYYQRCKAFIFTPEEDFGLTPVEAQACGTPVIAYDKGGALETVIEGKTGHFFDEQTPESLAQAVLAFEKLKIRAKECRNNALRFDKEIFKKKLKTFIEEKYKAFYHVPCPHH